MSVQKSEVGNLFAISGSLTSEVCSQSEVPSTNTRAYSMGLISAKEGTMSRAPPYGGLRLHELR